MNVFSLSVTHQRLYMKQRSVGQAHVLSALDISTSGPVIPAGPTQKEFDDLCSHGHRGHVACPLFFFMSVVVRLFIGTQNRLVALHSALV